MGVSVASDLLAGGSLIVSGYAAWTANAARSWQRKRDRERLQTRVTVTFEHQADRRHGGDQWEGDPPPPFRELAYYLTIVVRNDGETTEWIAGLDVLQALPDEDGPCGFDFEIGSADGELRPRQRFTRRVAVHTLPFDTAPGFVGIARLASGVESRSEVEHLMPELVEHVETFRADQE
jgi:hypothetical protein